MKHMTKAYKRIDLQGSWDDRYYESKEEMQESLVNLHLMDCDEEDEEYIKAMTLEQLLKHGEWAMEEVEGEWIDGEFIENK